ncbi:MAG: hypothetical protein RJA63_2952 [Pseudomonadota bacterium]|jgi:hypothetical protein
MAGTHPGGTAQCSLGPMPGQPHGDWLCKDPPEDACCRRVSTAYRWGTKRSAVPLGGHANTQPDPPRANAIRPYASARNPPCSPVWSRFPVGHAALTHSTNPTKACPENRSPWPSPAACPPRQTGSGFPGRPSPSFAATREPTPADADGLAPDRHMRRQSVSSRAAIRSVRPAGQPARLSAKAAAGK